jgi:hypothetical protein
MAGRRLRAQWAETERLLRIALAEVEPRLGGFTRKSIVDFLDANELGLAHETLVEAILSDELPISDSAYGALARAAALMDLSDWSEAELGQLLNKTSRGR